MEKLFEIFVRKIQETPLAFRRYLLNAIDWSERLIAIKGARGVGKTTLLLQYIKEHFDLDESVLYVSLDNLYFQTHTLVDLADEFVRQGGQFLFLDEVHKYPTWSVELKNIYDNHSTLKVVFTGSSMLEIYRGDADLSRRAIAYEMHGLSLREFLWLDQNVQLPAYSLEEILQHHVALAQDILAVVKPIPAFRNYLTYGYYPFFAENRVSYPQRLTTVVNLILETDLPAIQKVDYMTINKLKKLLYIIATAAPFKPNITKLSERIATSRDATLRYLDYLKRAHVINLLRNDTEGISYLTKPEKIFLNNTNLMYALASERVETGNLRETFFYNQLYQAHAVSFEKAGDFVIDKKYTFEVGGRNKSYAQLKGVEQAYVVADDIEVGFKNKIPLWLFGFLY